MNQKIEINDYYEYEMEIKFTKTSGKLMNNIAIVELRLYEKNVIKKGKKTDGGTTARSLVNIFTKEVKKPNIVEFLLGLSWEKRIDSARDHLKNKAIYNAAERWCSEILPKEMKDLLEDIDKDKDDFIS